MPAQNPVLFILKASLLGIVLRFQRPLISLLTRRLKAQLIHPSLYVAHLKVRPEA